MLRIVSFVLVLSVVSTPALAEEIKMSCMQSINKSLGLGGCLLGCLISIIFVLSLDVIPESFGGGVILNSIEFIYKYSILFVSSQL